uniref:Uncharacterized protein n=1 Tax=Populus trichocarpa TaxID=3694 RepID=A9P956_POPTR|nr:unknown [Populus trichocarpa]
MLWLSDSLTPTHPPCRCGSETTRRWPSLTTTSPCCSRDHLQSRMRSTACLREL